MLKHLSGVVTAMVTPLHDDETINLESVTQLTHFLIDKGISGLFPLGTNGECMRLSVLERKAVAETVIKAASRSDVPVFVHTGAVAMADTLELTRHAQAIGADGVAVVTPSYFKLTDEELFEFYKTVAESVSSDFPIYVYNIPQCTVNDISVSLMKRLYTEIPNIVGIKYSFADTERTQAYCAIEGLSVLHGADTLYPEMMTLGCDGIVSGLSGAYPEPFVKQVQANNENRTDDVLYWREKALLVGEATDHGNISHIKYIISQRGINVGDIRRPALPPSEEKRAIIRTSMKEIDKEIS